MCEASLIASLAVSSCTPDNSNKTLPGLPTENRVLILSPKDINTTKSGIIIPGTVSEGVPRKGVVVKRGTITEEYKTYTDLTEVGRVVTYGMYAGKELVMDYFTQLKSGGVGGKKLSNSSFSRNLSALRSFYRYLNKYENIVF